MGLILKYIIVALFKTAKNNNWKPEQQRVDKSEQQRVDKSCLI